MALKEEEGRSCAEIEDDKGTITTIIKTEEGTSQRFKLVLKEECSVKDEENAFKVDPERDDSSCELSQTIDSVTSQRAEASLCDKLVLNKQCAFKDEDNTCKVDPECDDSSSYELSQTIDNFSSQSTSNEDFVKQGSNSERKKSELSSCVKKEYASPSPPSRQKLRSTKRRAGILYKQLKSSKLCKVTSEYFSQVKNSNHKRWIPPRSPYALVQEDLFDKPWQLLVATVFLTKTAAKKALPQLHKFLAQYPQPKDVLKANYEDLDEYFKPLGLTTTRSHIIMRFTVEYLEKDWTYPRELYGIGKYGDDSYRMFCINEWRQVSPDDIPLAMYRNWLLENAERLGID